MHVVLDEVRVALQHRPRRRRAGEREHVLRPHVVEQVAGAAAEDLEGALGQQPRLDDDLPDPLLFGEKEGRIALANRGKEPLLLFNALQRQLGYPAVPRPEKTLQNEELLEKLQRIVGRLEVRIKLLEDEQREKGIDLSQFMVPDPVKHRP